MTKLKLNPKAFCPHCGNVAPQRLMLKHSHTASAYNFVSGQKSESDVEISNYVAICTSCEGLLLYENFLDIRPDEEFHENELIHPTRGRIDSEVPENIRNIFAEAIKVRFSSPSSYAMLARKTIEAICVDHGITQGSLFERLRALSQRGELPASIIELTEIIRIIGNSGAHHDDVPVTIPMTWAIDDFIKIIFDYIYVIPDRVQYFKEKYEKAKQNLVNPNVSHVARS